MVNGLEIAKKFHDKYEELASNYGYATRKDTQVFNEESPNGRLMVAVCQAIGDGIQKEGFDAGFQRGIQEKYVD